MTHSHSTESTVRRPLIWLGIVLMAVSAAACGGTSQSLTGIAPSSLSAVAASTDGGGTFSALKEGKGKGPGKGGDTPTTGTVPEADDPAEEEDRGHGKSAMQIEGFTTSITGTCPAITIGINGLTVTTDENTEFQRAECTDLAPATTTPTPTTTTKADAPTTTTPTTHDAAAFHLHIAAKKDATGALVATYVRMQGPRIGDD